MKKDKEVQETSSDADSSETQGELIFGPDRDGMGTWTAKAAIDRNLRKRLLAEYDLVELVNQGRYYSAKAYSKDGLWAYDLLIDKQTESIQVAYKKRHK
jgi:hypothetical protein